MTQVDIRVLFQDLSPVLEPASGTIRIQAYSGTNPRRRVDGEDVIFSRVKVFGVSSGEPDAPIELVPTDGTFCYRWEIEAAGRSLIVYTSVPDSPTPVDFEDLPEVDPLTFAPTASNTSAWKLIVAEVTALRDQTLGYRDDAAESADDAAASATDAAGSATQAGASADAATTAAGSAGGSAAAASASAASASGSAAAAAGSATSAADSATAAGTSATNAAGSATAAAGSAASAGSRATAADGSATSAAGSASAAQTARTGAESARDAAQTARTGAETARTGAETAQTGAQTARTGAETAQTGAQTARTGAETARTGAEAARDLALAGQFAGTSLGSADLNTIITPGVYRQGSSAALALNYPAVMLGNLIVYRAAQPAPGDWLTQEYHPVNNLASAAGRVFWRRVKFDSTWSAWRAYSSQRISSPGNGQTGVEVFPWDDVNGREQAVHPIGMALGTTDLNSVTVPGTYSAVPADATTARNYPVANAAWFIEVLRLGTDANALMMRAYVQSGVSTNLGRGHWERRKNGSWDAWSFIPTQRINSPAGQPGFEVFSWNDVASADFKLAPVNVPLGSANLDAVLLDGTYYQDNGANATTANNYPAVATNTAGILRVSRRNHDNWIVQEWNPLSFVSTQQQITLIRRRINSTWQAWQIVPTSLTDNSVGRRQFLVDEVNGRLNMVYGDTGRRQFVTADMLNGVTGNWTLRRNGYTVSIEGNPAPQTDIPAGSATIFGVVPAGFRPTMVNMRQPFRTSSSTVMQGIMIASTTFEISLYAFQNYTVNQGPLPFSLTFQTTDAWPTSLPGAALGVIPVN